MASKFIIIVGCGRLGSILANKLSLGGHSLVVIDRDPPAFSALSNDFSGFTIEGDATEQWVLQKARMAKADMVLVSTDSDNVNLMVSQVAREVYGVQKVFARVQNPAREIIFQNLNILTICPTLLASEEFLRQTEEM